MPFVPPAAGGSRWLRAVALVALFGLTAGVGVAGTTAMRHALPHLGPDPALQTALRGTREQVTRLAADVAQLRAAGEAAKPDDQTRALRRAVDALRADIEQLRAATTAAGTQSAARLDKLERDPAGPVAELSARLDRLEHVARADAPAAPEAPRDRVVANRAGSDKDPVGAIPPPAVAAEPARVAAAPAKPPQAATVARTASAAPARPVEAAVAPGAAKAATPPPARLAAVLPAKLPPTAPAMPVARPGAAALASARSETTAVPAAAPAAATPVRGWVLRDVYDGLAVVEAQSGDLREIGPGEYLPGAGEVRSIQRRGRSWVVLTSRGVIEAATFER